MRRSVRRLLVLSVKLGSASSGGLGRDLPSLRRLDASPSFPRRPSVAAASGRDHRGAFMQPNSSIEKAITSILPTIKSIALRLDKNNAEDITQDVALKLLKIMPDERRLRGQWLSKVVQNTVIDRKRAERREAQYRDLSVSLDISGSVCEGLDEQKWYTPWPLKPQSIEHDVILALTKCLQQLSAQQRQALVLLAAGYSCDEIAAITGARAGTVRSRIYYARKHARKLLEPILS